MDTVRKQKKWGLIYSNWAFIIQISGPSRIEGGVCWSAKLPITWMDLYMIKRNAHNFRRVKWVCKTILFVILLISGFSNLSPDVLDFDFVILNVIFLAFLWGRVALGTVRFAVRFKTEELQILLTRHFRAVIIVITLISEDLKRYSRYWKNSLLHLYLQYPFIHPAQTIGI